MSTSQSTSQGSGGASDTASADAVMLSPIPTPPRPLRRIRHATATLGPGSLVELLALRPDDPVELVADDGRSARWRVSRIRDGQDHPYVDAVQDAILVSEDTRAVTLVCCGGAFLGAQGRFQEVVVIDLAPDLTGHGTAGPAGA